MNCKPGDLAIVVRCKQFPEDVGLVVRVKNASENFPGYWVTEHSPITKELWTWTIRPDSGLKPIRDQPGDDETLQWAPVPSDAITV